MLPDGKQPFRAGEWTVEPELNALRRDTEERRVEPKVMQVLLTLASRQNHVFSKSELIRAVWPDTFVSEDVLTRCISILRRITADDPQAPKFIQTVPKVGYRLLAPVAAVGSAPGSKPADEVLPVLLPAARSPDPEKASTLVRPAGAGIRPRWFWLFAALLGIGCALLLAALLRRAPSAGSVRSTPDLHLVPLTSEPGEQSQPAFSPDGERVALVRTGEDGVSRRICIKRIGQESCPELPSPPGAQWSPAWSHDGGRLAFLARDGSHNGLWIADLSGRAPPVEVYRPEEPSDWQDGALSWSPDNRELVLPDHQRGSPSSVIMRLHLGAERSAERDAEPGAKPGAEPITAPPPGWEGDLNPAYSPDGARIAFTRASETAVRDLYWISVRDGAVHRITDERADIRGLAWTPDSRALVFSSNKSGQYALWRVGLDGRPPERLPVGTDNATEPAIGARPGQLVYTQGSAVWSIDRLGGRPVLTSTQEDSAPSLSPDGRWFAFQSRRSGTQQIWISSLDGGGLRQLTGATGSMAGSPAWSHGGGSILFDARPGGHSHIYRIAAAGGPAEQLTFGDSNDIVPRWSNDDRAVYFRSNRGGEWALWKLALGAGAPVQVSKGDGMAAQESADGHAVFFTRGDEAGLWKVDLASGREAKVSSSPPAGDWGYLQATDAGLLTLGTAHGRAELLLLDPASGASRPAGALQHTPPAFQGLSATRDGKLVLVTGEREAERHITLVSGLPF